MKILQIIYELVPGGAERFVVDLSNELANNGHYVGLYTLRDDSIKNQGFYVPELSEKIRYSNLKIKPGFKPWLVWKFYRIIKAEMPDIVHCHLNLVNYFFLSSILFRNKIKFLYTIHNSAETEVASQMERSLRRFFFGHRFFIPVAISDETKRSYQAYYNLNSVPVIYNGRKFSGKTIDYEKVVNELNILKPTNETLIFCHVSRFDEKQKNHKTLINVFNILKKEGSDIILLIIGEGFEDAIELKGLAKDHIHFLGIKSNVNDYLFASDAFCLSSNFEGMPISLIEAFACGCPAICTPVGGIVDTIRNGETGFLSKTGSEADYLDAIKQFIGQGRAIRRDNLTRFYHQNFSIEECTRKYLKLYSE